MKKEWIIESTDSNEKSLIKRLLVSRGIKTSEEMKEFLNPLEMTLTSPNAFTDMQKTVERLSKAIDNEETIIVYGDFEFCFFRLELFAFSSRRESSFLRIFFLLLFRFRCFPLFFYLINFFYNCTVIEELSPRISMIFDFPGVSSEIFGA